MSTATLSPEGSQGWRARWLNDRDTFVAYGADRSRDWRWRAWDVEHHSNSPSIWVERDKLDEYWVSGPASSWEDVVKSPPVAGPFPSFMAAKAAWRLLYGEAP